jgi:hypothetical protein
LAWRNVNDETSQWPNGFSVINYGTKSGKVFEAGGGGN